MTAPARTARSPTPAADPPESTPPETPPGTGTQLPGAKPEHGYRDLTAVTKRSRSDARSGDGPSIGDQTQRLVGAQSRRGFQSGNGWPPPDPPAGVPDEAPGRSSAGRGAEDRQRRHGGLGDR